MSTGRECAIAYKTLLEFVHKIVLKPTADLKAKLPVYSREVAVAVSEIILSRLLLNQKKVLDLLTLLIFHESFQLWFMY